MILDFPSQPQPAECCTEIGAEEEGVRPMQMLAWLCASTALVAVIAAAALIL